ncbi:MAG TPA: hypothetical protein DD473_15190 [Planctomycetaceae bacterium]|nr:hypothetical protein [Planctomycetaceae bacterium]|tara:strand:- start:1878 stop:2066 length:189 start_codon:yes stop_codon:yes gene_type:complete
MLPHEQTFSGNENTPQDCLEIPAFDNNSWTLPGWHSRFVPILNNGMPRLAQGILLAQTALML